MDRPQTKTPQKIFFILSGIFAALVILETGLRIGGLIFLSLQEHRNLSSIKETGNYRIVCVGESTTAGGEKSYPSQLETTLNNRNTGIRFSVINKGIPGTKTSGILSRIQDDIEKYKPQMVVAMMGINDHGALMAHAKGTSPLMLFKVCTLAKLIMLHLGEQLHKMNASGAGMDREIHSLLTVNLSGAAVPNAARYMEVGLAHREREEFSQAEKAFLKAIEIDPKNSKAYTQLGWTYSDSGNFRLAETHFRKAIAVDSNWVDAYHELGKFYHGMQRFPESESILKRALKIQPNEKRGIIHLIGIYIHQKRFYEAEELLQNTIRLNPIEPDTQLVFYGQLATIYGETGKRDLAKEFYEKARDIEFKYYNTETKRNYLELKRVLDEKNILLVAVQYPVRNVEPLKKILEDAPGVIFVDNERVFKDELNENRYSEFFEDSFAGDFGHCTPKGNRLLAENITDAILKEIVGGR